MQPRINDNEYIAILEGTMLDLVIFGAALVDAIEEEDDTDDALACLKAAVNEGRAALKLRDVFARRYPK